MSIAYGFDPDISPIYEDDNGTYHSAHFSSADTPRKSGRVTNQTMGASRIDSNLSSFHDFHQECAPISESTVEESDFRERQEEDSDENVPDSRDGVLEAPDFNDDDDDENVPESVGFLADTWIVLSAGCCLPIRHHLSKKLKEMGAEVQQNVDYRTTHVVVDRYGDESIVGKAMARRPHPPAMVDIKWIQECLDHRKKCQESDYSMQGLRYLKQTCRRLSSFREPSPMGQEASFFEDFDDEEAPNDPKKLLEEIRKLSDRLDALLDYEPVIRFEYHSPDCPTRQHEKRRSAIPPPRNPLNLPPEDVRRLLTTISTLTTIRRRRSFSGYILEHREPENLAVEVQKMTKDVREIWEKPKGKSPKKSKKAPQKTVNDMRKTMAADLTTIRNTLGRNADLNRARTPAKKTQKAVKKPLSRQKMEPVRADDSDIESALASLSISGARNGARRALQKSSVLIVEDSRRPLVPTASNVINRLQKRSEEEDDDFISDVSAYIQMRNQKKIIRDNEEEEKNEVVFTGFSKDSPIETRLKSIIRRFRLNVATEIDDRRTLCVVSRHGKRTLVVLKAICCNVPIIRPQWLEESFEDSQLLSIDDYVYEEWLLIQNNRIFENFHLKMWISSECTPEAKELAWMVEKCGGKVTRHLHKADLAIAPEAWEMPEIHVGHIEVVTPLFLIDSISMAALQSFRDYMER
ncbi:Protein CBG13622 [Caenorhabditis briggsae]|uniref:BRCT domain-containing protein n=2 Tax=Caenorhabditis briggsae TaxID=6238 RepID=A0AAE9J022_CAEBR|nr:Protein CBG13622 [Caenorhabditis briggsae]ULU13451.1 hypothetical protein L3Y34_016156 [Caenorhabditis briggsae]CAP32393.2 Protein CBG13622 [Caenorhabditis briggsae]